MLSAHLLEICKPLQNPRKDLNTIMESISAVQPFVMMPVMCSKISEQTYVFQTTTHSSGVLRLEQVARNAIALDMEASAFLKLCAYAGISSLGVVKGISDFGDSEKGKVPNAYGGALQNTAIALKEWVIHTIPAMNWQLDEGKSH
jgi:uridine phosphorylase